MAIYWSLPHFMYCVFGGDDELLYVGISSQPECRLSEHSRNAAWFAQKARVELSRFDDRHLALAAEKKKIKDFKPIYNLQHNPRFLQKGRKFVSCID